MYILVLIIVTAGNHYPDVTHYPVPSKAACTFQRARLTFTSPLISVRGYCHEVQDR